MSEQEIRIRMSQKSAAIDAALASNDQAAYELLLNSGFCIMLYALFMAVA